MSALTRIHRRIDVATATMILREVGVKNQEDINRALDSSFLFSSNMVDVAKLVAWLTEELA